MVEKDYGDGEERFLTDEPIDLIQRGEFAHVPLILGVTRDEFSYQSYGCLLYTSRCVKKTGTKYINVTVNDRHVHVLCPTVNNITFHYPNLLRSCAVSVLLV